MNFHTVLRTALLTSAISVAASPALAQQPVAGEADYNIVVTGSRAASASINGLVIDPLLLPQNVRILSSDLIDQAGFTDLSQMFYLAGGMARQNSFGGAWDAYAIRGFSGDINQGPASALSGKGEPGGSINIVTKAPLDHVHASTELSYASFDTVRASADFGGPVSGTVGARMIAVYQRGDSFRDYNKNDRLLLAPSISWQPNESVRFLYQFDAYYLESSYSNIWITPGGPRTIRGRLVVSL